MNLKILKACLNSPNDSFFLVCSLPFIGGKNTALLWLFLALILVILIMIQQYHISLPPYKRGFHLITNFILDKFENLPEKGLLNVFIKHTSAGITINENADPSVRVDFESAFSQLAKENEPYYTHTFEGADDMPAHIKATLVGSSVTIPIVDGKLDLGTWQGIYLGEFRDRGGSRKLTITVYS